MSDAIKPGFPPAGPGGPSESSKPVRVWPAILIVAFIWAALMLPTRLFPDSTMLAFLGAMWGTMLGCLLFVLWWAFFSRVSWKDVGLGVIVVASGIAAVLLAGHKSIGIFAILLHTAPWLLTAVTAWLALTSRLSWPVRRNAVFAIALAVCAVFLAIRFEGTNGEFVASWRPRWQTTDEDLFLAEYANRKPKGLSAEEDSPLTARPGDWLEFRGSAQRDGVCRGVTISTDWQKSPPKLLWKHRVGPGWSSFTAVGDHIFTQEQRGEKESVVCYDAATGSEIWAHDDDVRFWEAVAGAGPRATPTFHDGKIYAQGATGKLNCLDARTGKAIWSRDLMKDSQDKNLKVPTWGFSASPLVAHGLVTVFAGAKDAAVFAYDAKTGEPVWQGGNGPYSYCSTQLSKIAGVEQLLLATNLGVVSLDPKTGKELWNYDWPLQGELSRVTQPNVISETDLLIGTGFDNGTRRLRVTHDGGTWSTSKVWETRKINPYYNDFVVYKDHLYGFDGKFFTCVDLKEGKREWRERGYGNGQVLLLADQGLLVVLTETGEVALVEATPSGHKELARIDGIEGKTWNHPVIAHGRLFIRNGQEAACFELAPNSPSR